MLRAAGSARFLTADLRNLACLLTQQQRVFSEAAWAEERSQQLGVGESAGGSGEEGSSAGAARASSGTGQADGSPVPNLTSERWGDLQNDGRWPVRLTNLDPTAGRRDVERLFAEFGLFPLEVRAEYHPDSITLLSLFAVFRTKAEAGEAASLSGTSVGVRRVAISEMSYRRMCGQLQANTHTYYNGSGGRFVLVENVPEISSTVDIFRFCDGFQLSTHPTSLVKDMTGSGRGMRAVLRFTSAMEAERAVRELSGSYLLKNKVTMRVLT